MLARYGFIGIAAFIAIMVSLYYEPWLSERLGPWVQSSFEHAGKCSMHARATTCTLFSPSITFHDVQVTCPQQQRWQWSADRYTIRFSWLYLLLYGMVDLHITIDGLRVHSAVNNNQPAIIEHIINLTTGQGYAIPTFIASCALTNGTLTLTNHDYAYTCTTQFMSSLQRIDADFHSTASLLNGRVYYHDTLYTIINEATISAIIPGNTTITDTTSSLHATITLPTRDNYQCSLHGDWRNNTGNIIARTPDHHDIMACTDIHHDHDGTWRAQVTSAATRDDIRALCNNMMPYIDALHMNGALRTDGITHTVDNLTIALTIPNIYNLSHAQYDGSLRVTGTQLSGLGTVTMNNRIPLATEFACDTSSGNGTCTCSNKDSYAVPLLSSWQLAPHTAHMHIVRNNGTIQLDVTSTLTHTHDHHPTCPCTAHATVNEGKYDVVMHCPAGSLEAVGTIQPECAIAQAVVSNAHHDPLLYAHTYPHHPNRLHLDITERCLKQLGATLLGYHIQGEGTCTGDLQLGAIIAGRIRLRDGSIRLPGVHNVIRNFDIIGTYDCTSSTCMIKQGVCNLDRGTLRTDGTRIIVNHEGKLQFAYVPIALHRCMVIIDRGIFASVSADMHITAREQEPIHLDGHVFIDQAYVEGNIFSHLFQQTMATSTRNLFMRDYAGTCVCSLTCESVEPIRIKTAFLETKADLTMRIAGNVSEPTIAGQIVLNGGSLFFPYKPLYITRGAIYFDEHQPHNSLIELIASNTIKQHTVSMVVSGSLQQNNVNLIATPTLSEEQILSLLLIGSHDSSLNIVMPALIMQNLSALIFDKKQSPSQLDSFFGRLLQPFEHIRFMPVFADQSGRGGLRGTLELELSDRLRATIQKNFSLLEDTRFEVEYAVSDDVILRGMRNERRDVGGEVEVKWKF